MKTNKYLVNYANAQVGNPYWFGCFGQKATTLLLNQKKSQYPSYYTASDFNSQVKKGKKVHDCVGLIKGALWCDTNNSMPKYNSKEDVSASGMYSASKKKGKISTMPKVNGILVYKGTSPSKIHHVGIYNDGYVTEAKGHAYGVVREKFNDSWNYWSYCPFIEYIEDKKEEKKKDTIDKASYFDHNITGKYKTVSELNLRVGSGTDKSVVCVLKNKQRVTCYGYYNKVGDTKWYLVETDDGKVGFCSSKYLRGY